MSEELTWILELLTNKLQSRSELKTWDAYAKRTKEINITAERGSIKTAESVLTSGYAVRMYDSQGKLGLAHSNICTEAGIDQTVETAARLCSATTPDPDFYDLPYPCEIQSRGLPFVDLVTRDATEEDIFGILASMLDRHVSNQRLYSISCKAGTSSSDFAVVNSHGVNIHEESTSANVSFEAVIKDGANQVSGWWFDAATGLGNLDPTGISDKAIARAEAGLHRDTIQTGDWPVILGPLAVASIIMEPLADAIDAENVEYERTFLKDAVGTEIGTPLFSILDDPHQSRLTGSEYFDDEGVPTRRLDLVKDGTLLTLLHNSYSAQKVGTDSTGHASRASIGAPPGIAPHNLIMPAGDATVEELFEEIQYGIYLDYTGASPNPATGDFSGLILQGNLIQSGELGPALLNTLIGINLRNLYASIEAVGKDLTVWGSISCPHIKIPSARITSGE